MILFYSLIVVILLNLFYYLVYLKFALSRSHTQRPNSSHPISLLVCAKNEAINLRKNIPLWLEQHHSNFELILINDNSSDATLDVMEEFALNDTRIKIVDVIGNETFWANKKYALTLGIKRAQNSRMIFTDADCKPAGKQWLSLMANNFTSEKQIVLGYGAYAKTKGLLNKLIRFETLVTAANYFSFAKLGIPYMGVGRNLGYTSKVYYSANGFMSHIKILSGDDDLFINEASNSQNVALCDSPNAFTISEPKKRFSAWINQKRRHISTAKYYKPIHKLILGLLYLSNLLFWILAGLSFFFAPWKLVLIVVLLRLLFQFFVFKKLSDKFKENDLVWLIPFYELFLLCFQLFIFISGSKRTRQSWK